MGLDITHDCWHGAYSAFMRWRCEIAKAAGMPPLKLMEGFYEWKNITHEEVHEAVSALGFKQEHAWASSLLQAFYCGANMPIKWECLKPSPLILLLHHSDCDGDIQASECTGIADALESLLPALPEGDGGGHVGDWRKTTQTFIDGLRIAAKNGENVEFH